MHICAQKFAVMITVALHTHIHINTQMAIEHRMRPHLRGQVMHQRQLSQTIPCISRKVKGQPGHSLLQASMSDDEELECALSTKSSARAQALEDALRKERTRADQGVNVCVHVRKM